MQMDCKKTAPVGVFDSGVGGLTVAREISRQLPNENIVYFGDTARVPYGSKSQNTIIRFSEQIIRFLKTKQVKAIVIACNTASALALDAVRDECCDPGRKSGCRDNPESESRSYRNGCDCTERNVHESHPKHGSGY